MAYTGSARTAYGQFNDQAAADAFAKAARSSNTSNITAGQYFTGEGGTQYKTVSGVDPNQPGWGQRVEPGYQLVGYKAPVNINPRAGTKTEGVAILKKIEQPAPAPAVEEPVAAAVDTTPEVKPTEKSEEYTREADKILGQARSIAEQMALQQKQDDQARRLQEQAEAQLRQRLAIQSAANIARSQMQASLKISPSSQTSSTAGTSAFKRRGTSLSALPIQKTVGINVPTSNRLNV